MRKVFGGRVRAGSSARIRTRVRRTGACLPDGHARRDETHKAAIPQIDGVSDCRRQRQAIYPIQDPDCPNGRASWRRSLQAWRRQACPNHQLPNTKGVVKSRNNCPFKSSISLRSGGPKSMFSRQRSSALDGIIPALPVAVSLTIRNRRITNPLRADGNGLARFHEEVLARPPLTPLPGPCESDKCSEQDGPPVRRGRGHETIATKRRRFPAQLR